MLELLKIPHTFVYLAHQLNLSLSGCAAVVCTQSEDLTEACFPPSEARLATAGSDFFESFSLKVVPVEKLTVQAARPLSESITSK